MRTPHCLVPIPVIYTSIDQRFANHIPRFAHRSIIPNMEPVGYGLVASCIDSDNDLAMYRRFGVLNTRNLLYLQSELMALEEQLKQLDTASNDRTKGVDVWSIPRSWYHLEKENGRHLEVVLKIRDRLDAYSRFLEYPNLCLDFC
jgi:hypothetical protein